VDPVAWEAALEYYWTLIEPENVEHERRMDALSLDRVRAFDADGWFAFLHDEYFPWKYTAPNRYAMTTKTLAKKMDSPPGREELLRIRDQLLRVRLDKPRAAIELACKIPGLGTAGASGLVALLYPESFGTVDQFVVKALREVPEFADNFTLASMNPESLTPSHGEFLIRIMRRKARSLTASLKKTWTPRMVDRVLWTYGRLTNR
jgi:hypothetical protein